MESPNNSAYSKIYWWDMYDSKTANGVFAIVTNGYPNNTGGFTEEQARYATANALRFWLGECGAEGAYDWMNLQTYPNNFRGKSGYEDLFDWCVALVEIARAETDGIPYIDLRVCYSSSWSTVLTWYWDSRVKGVTATGKTYGYAL